MIIDIKRPLRRTFWPESEATSAGALGGEGRSRGPLQVGTEVWWQEVEVVLV